MPDGTIQRTTGLYGHGATLRHVADKHFPNQGFDRDILIDAARAFDQLTPLQHKLTLIQQQLAHLGGIDRPDSVDVRYIAASLEKTAQWMGNTHKEEAEILKGTSDVLMVWNDVSWHLERLIEIAADFQVLHGRPGGNA